MMPVEDVVFDEERALPRSMRPVQTPPMIRLLVQAGIIEDEASGPAVLLGIALTCLAAAIAVVLVFGSSDPSVPADPSYRINDDSQYQADQARWERNRARGIIR